MLSQHQEQRRRHAVDDQVEYRALLNVGIPEIERQQASNIDEELHIERLIKSERAAQFCDEVGRGAAGLGGDDVCCISRRKMQQKEVQRSDGQYDRDDLQQTPEDEPELCRHRCSFRCGRA